MNNHSNPAFAGVPVRESETDRPGLEEIVPGELYLYHRDDRSCPSESSLWGVVAWAEDGVVCLRRAAGICSFSGSGTSCRRNISMRAWLPVRSCATMRRASPFSSAGPESGCRLCLGPAPSATIHAVLCHDRPILSIPRNPEGGCVGTTERRTLVGR